MKNFTYTLSKKSYTFTNSRKKPTLTVKYGSEELLEGLNYDISYVNNKYPGTAIVTATGLNNCTGEKDNKFKITMPKVTGFKVSKNASNSITYKWTANTNVTGYKVYQYIYSTGKYKLVKTINKNTKKTYTAKNLSSAAKYRYRVKTYLTYNKKTYLSSACGGKTTYTNPSKEKKVKLKRSKSGKKLKVTYKKLDRVTGYTILLATNKKFTKNVRVKTVKYWVRKVKIKKCIKNKTYYAKVRGYLKVGNKYYYGSYSNVVKKKGVK